ncbi:MAG: hypothetical protein RIB02_05805 [Vicingaceae bacterium]
MHCILLIFVPMKFFAAVLGIFFLCLAVMPCADAAPTDETAIELSQEHEHEGEADNCAPLCYCHCCHVHATLSSDFQTLTNLPDYGKPAMHYSASEPNSSLTSLFRPPIV